MSRLGLALGGVACIAAGVVLLVSNSPGNAERLGRVAGILIIVGLVCCGGAAIGHL
jgi:hypothetical protein